MLLLVPRGPPALPLGMAWARVPAALPSLAPLACPQGPLLTPKDAPEQLAPRVLPARPSGQGSEGRSGHSCQHPEAPTCCGSESRAVLTQCLCQASFPGLSRCSRALPRTQGSAQPLTSSLQRRAAGVPASALHCGECGVGRWLATGQPRGLQDSQAVLGAWRGGLRVGKCPVEPTACVLRPGRRGGS